MEEEIKTLFKMAYLPVMYANQRLNGGDFVSVAIPLMDYLREKLHDEAKLKKAARIMVFEFNNMLDPQMDVHLIDEFIETIYKPGPLIRSCAKHTADEFARKYSSK